MDAQLRSRVKELFGQAIEKPREQRSAFLDGACAGDPDLRACVEAMVTACAQVEMFRAAPSDITQALPEPASQAVGTTVDAAPIREGPGTRLGRYTILQLIGEGGFGNVYMAEQHEPIHRLVALKIIKLGMDTRQVIARFEAERQALAMMDHPSIARVLDAGSTESGRPYFVMELVRGVPITDYCDSSNLTTRQRLELFIQVCRAVQHAHQKGIIHRDLKPSNVLITLHDGEPLPKVIDFGIAKAMHQHAVGATVFTGYHQLVGTPAYMSPEQAEMGGIDIDTRSDIYSLGVLLYEMLTGATPIDAERLAHATREDLHRAFRELEPPRPSERLHTLGEAVTTIAARRRTDPRHLSTQLRGELDWIVMKAMEKDRTRRYETAAALAQDVQHHLNGEPVSAGPPGAIYRMGKFGRRHWFELASVSALILALVLGIIGTSIGMMRAERALLDAQRAETVASRQRDRAMSLLAEVKATQAREDVVRRAQLAHRLVDSLVESARVDEAIQLRRDTLADLRQHLGDAHPDTIDEAMLLADLLARQGRFSEAMEQRIEQIALMSKALVSDASNAMLLRGRAWHYLCLGRFPEARDDYARALQINPDNHWSWYYQGCLLAVMGDRERHLAHCRAMLSRFEQSPSRPIAERTAKVCLLMSLEKPELDRALKMLDTALEGGRHGYSDWFKLTRGIACYRTGQYSESIEALREAKRTLVPPSALATAELVEAMGHYRLGHTAEARACLEQAHRMMKQVPRIGVEDLGRDGAENTLICHTMFREAEELLGGALPPATMPFR